MLNWPTITDRVILFTTVVLILYNIVACLLGGAEATLSARIQFHGYRFPVIPLAIGGVVCHWFWPIFSSRH